MGAGYGAVEVFPATAERWNDLETLFGPNGASAGCWCMWWRLERTEFKRIKGEGRKAALKELVCGSESPGLLAYVDGRPVGWCSIGPRETFAALENSRILKRIDDTLVWSIVCFFITKKYRNKGIMADLLRAAVDYATSRGAQVVEGYPLDLQSHLLAGQTLTRFSGYMGIASAFRAAGFESVASASETQLIMRYTITSSLREEA
jgi:GNAT superfamily N-acetyltransferase